MNAADLCERLAWTLLHQLWLATLLVLIAVSVVRLLRIDSPSGRHHVFAVTLLPLLLTPLATFWLLAPAPPTPEPDNEPARSLSVNEHDHGSEFVGPDVLTIEAGPETLEHSATPGRTWTLWVAVGYLFGLAFSLLRLGWGCMAVECIRLRSTSLTGTARSLSDAVAERLGFRQSLDIRVSRRCQEAFAAGLLRPFVVIPSAWLLELTPQMLEAVVAHEVAHLLRRDLWINVLQRCVEALLFFHPAVWWLSRRLRRERELACDRLAVSATGEAVVYARTLAHLLERSRLSGRPAAAAGLGGDAMPMLTRVRSVLGGKPARGSLWPVAVTGLALAAVTWTGFTSSPEVEAAIPVESLFGLQDGERERDGDRERNEDRERDGERERDGDRDWERPREGDGDRERDRPRDGDRERERDGDRARDLDPEGPERRMQTNRERRMQIERMRREYQERLRNLDAELRRLESGDGPPRDREIFRPDERNPFGRVAPREGDRPQEGDGPRDGDRGREGDRPREGFQPPEGDRPRDGFRSPEGDRPRDGDRMRELDRPRPEPPRELMQALRQLREEVGALRREVNELRKRRGRERDDVDEDEYEVDRDPDADENEEERERDADDERDEED